MPVAKADKLTLIHFNDVYNVEGRGVEPVGGAPRFLTAVKAASENVNPLILFSGDIFAPSISKSRGLSGIREGSSFFSEHLHERGADGSSAEPTWRPLRSLWKP